MATQHWSQREDSFLTRHYQRHGAEWCAERLASHTLLSVYRRASALGCTKRSQRIRWKPREIRILSGHYPDSGAIGCLRYLNRTHKAIKEKAARMGIRFSAI